MKGFEKNGKVVLFKKYACAWIAYNLIICGIIYESMTMTMTMKFIRPFIHGLK